MLKIRKQKKAQEEIIGFVLIILLVTIIALVFLGISVRKSSSALPSVELESFLQASMRYSTDCIISERAYDIKDLIVSCSNNENCGNESSCLILNRSLTQILDNSWKPGEESVTKMYKLDIISWNNRTLISLKSGNFTGNKIFSDLNLPSYGGNIRVMLEIDN